MKGRSGTKPGSILRRQIPIRTFAQWDDRRPGFCEVDLVAHDGGRRIRAGVGGPRPRKRRPGAKEARLGEGEVITGDALRLSELIAPTIRGRVALVLTSPPYGASVHGQAKAQAGAGVIKAHDRYSTDPANLAHQSVGRLLDAVTRILASCRDLLRPGGVVVLTVRPFRRAGALIDLPAAILRCGDAAGLLPYERNVALLAGLRGDHLVPRASFFALDQVRRARRAGRPLQVIAHEDVLVFRRPSRP